MINSIFFIICIFVVTTMFITYFKLSFLTFKYLFYYICDIFGSQNPAHDLAYQVPIIPFWASLFIMLVDHELLSSSPLQNVNTLYLASLPLLYITIYLVAMYHRYQKDMSFLYTINSKWKHP